MLAILFALACIFDCVLAAAPELHYFGGPVMTDPVKLYVVYYGDWAEKAISDTNYFLNNIGKSNWYSITRKYFKWGPNGEKIPISDQISVQKSIVIPGTRQTLNATVPVSTDHSPLINQLLNSNTFPEDPTAIYLVLTSFMFAYDFCGIHGSFNRNNRNLKWFYTGYPETGSGCGSQWWVGYNTLNGDYDMFLGTVSHELVETTRYIYYV